MYSTHYNDGLSVGGGLSEKVFAAARVLTRAAAVSFLLQFLISCVVFRVMGFYRLMDADEGHFLSAIRGVYNGLVPCRDFFFQQMPLFPYPYVVAMKIFGYGYEPCIWVSVLCGAGLAVVTSGWFTRYGGGLMAGWIGWCLVMLNAPILFWTPTIKNHAMPLFFGVLALYAASRPCGSKASVFWWSALAGFAAMWSVGTRLLALPFTLLAGYWILARVIAQPRSRNGMCGSIGFWAGASLPVLLILRSVFPHVWVFYFDVLGFHEIRSGSLGTFGTWQSVTAELYEMLCQGQFPAMLAVALAVSAWGVVLHFRRTPGSNQRNAESATRTFACSMPVLTPAYLTTVGIGASVLALLPAETFHQYFMVPMMFFILASAPCWWFLSHPRKKAVGICNAVLLLAIYGGTPWDDSIELFNHREWVYPRFPKEYGLADVRKISRTLAEVTGPDDPVFTTWQGFTFFANRRELPGNENFNARAIADKLTESQLHELHVASNAELSAAIRRGEPKAIVLGFVVSRYRDVLFVRDPATGYYKLNSKLFQKYGLVQQIGLHEVWVRK